MSARHFNGITFIASWPVGLLASWLPSIETCVRREPTGLLLPKSTEVDVWHPFI